MFSVLKRNTCGVIKGIEHETGLVGSLGRELVFGVMGAG